MLCRAACATSVTVVSYVRPLPLRFFSAIVQPSHAQAIRMVITSLSGASVILGIAVPSKVRVLPRSLLARVQLMHVHLLPMAWTFHLAAHATQDTVAMYWLQHLPRFMSLAASLSHALSSRTALMSLLVVSAMPVTMAQLLPPLQRRFSMGFARLLSVQLTARAWMLP